MERRKQEFVKQTQMFAYTVVWEEYSANELFEQIQMRKGELGWLYSDRILQR